MVTTTRSSRRGATKPSLLSFAERRRTSTWTSSTPTVPSFSGRKGPRIRVCTVLPLEMRRRRSREIGTFFFDDRSRKGFTLIELLIVIAIIGILAAIAIPNLLNAVQRGKQKRTMSDMRALATAIEAYAVDNNSYPAAACSSGIFTSGTENQLATNSFTNLTPTYIAQPPKADGWGRLMYYALG